MDTDFQNQFNELKTRILNVFIKLAGGRNRRATVVSAHLYLQKEITQAELKEITGYSSGTISKILNDYEEKKYIESTFKEDPLTKKPKKYYSTLGSFKDGMSKLFWAYSLFIPQIEKKLSEVKEKLQTPGLKEKNGYKQVERFVQNMEAFIPLYRVMLQKLQNMNGGKIDD